jgi:hypothetical protein
MAVESYGRTDDGIAWEVRHRLWSGPWWWVLTMPDGQVRQSPECYETERQALDAVEDARRQALAGLPQVETMASLRARAEAAEARAIAAEADARLMLAVVYEIGVDLSVDIVMSMADHGLTDEECIACGDLVATHAGAGPDALLAIMRRILAAAGGT